MNIATTSVYTMLLLKIVSLSIVIHLAGNAHASQPMVPTEPPYIVLSENLDEPNRYGFCFDTLGRGKSDLMHAHTCKPTKDDEPRSYPGNDTRFKYDASTGSILSFAFDGYCVQVLIAGEAAVFALLPCTEDPYQKFVYDESDRTLRLDKDQGRCISVASVTVPAGPWVKRSMLLEDCDDVSASLKQWTIVTD